MAAATLDQVLTSLNGVYDPQIQSVQQQQAALPAQFQAQTAGVDAAKNDAFNSILNGARARGTGVAFGGIPLQEQAQYTASTYAPALAKLQSDQLTQQGTLQDAINKINEDKMTAAQGIYDNGVKNDLAQQAQNLEQQKLNETIREYNNPQKTAGSALGTDFSSLFGGAAAPSTPTPTTPAPQFLGNNDLRGHLNYLAQKENNQDAAVALHYVGNDGKYSLNPYVTNPAIIAALNRLGATNVWRAGTTSSGPIATIAPPSHASSTKTNQYGGSSAGIGLF
jgi:hypothetical protein